jgi:hypothetical protein
MKLMVSALLAIACLIILNGTMVASAYIMSCGDDYCTEEYGEADPTNLNYCPLDCGLRTNSSWCESTYTLESPRDCATCPTCSSGSTCDTSRISNSDLTNWCVAKGYSSGGGSSTSPDLKNYWWIFLIIGAVIGHYYKKKR